MNNLKFDNIRRTFPLLVMAASSAAIQLLAQSFYPVFEDRAVEFYVEQVANSQAID